MNCPKCNHETLTRVLVGELEVNHCNECGGLWLDRDELPRLLEADSSTLRDLRRGSDRSGANARRGKCPRCATGLLRVASAIQRRVTVDKCADCGGVWLDGGELKALLDAVHD
jgi:Zn-finger nucleic acid-binding protein